MLVDITPEKCGTCDGTGIVGVFSHIDPETGEHRGNQNIGCETCHGSGKVYPAELVERIAKVIAADFGGRNWPIGVVDRKVAVAVLDALNGEMT